MQNRRTRMFHPMAAAQGKASAVQGEPLAPAILQGKLFQKRFLQGDSWQQDIMLGQVRGNC